MTAFFPEMVLLMLLTTCRGHEDCRAFEASDAASTEGGAATLEREAAAAAGGARPLEVSEVLRPHGAMVPHFFSPEERSKGAFTASECR